MNTHKTNLTFEEAQELMLKGVKVTQQHFAQYEWATCHGGSYVLFEDGNRCSWFDFWQDRKNWDGWGVWSPPEGDTEPTNEDVVEVGECKSNPVGIVPHILK